MAIATFKRYEKKFILSEAQYRAVIPELAHYMNFDENCQDGREYSIHNIYYDTDNSEIIRHSLARPYYKEKLRLRSYNIPASPDSKVFLELKKKTGGIVHKRRAVLRLGEAYQFLENGKRPPGIDYMNTQVLNEISFFLKNHEVRPAVYISYNRSALFGKDDREFRITFDRKIITRREELSIEKGRFGEELLPGRYLMEAKVSTAFPVWLAHLLSENRIYRTSFSKYGQEYTRCQENPESAYSLKKAG